MGYAEQLLGQNEQVIFLTRKHAFVILDDAIIDGLIAALMIAVAAYFKWWWPVLGLPLPALHFGWKYLSWKASLCLVTTRRVVVIEGVLSKKSVDSSLEKINDVKLTQSLWGRLFGYGTIDILTASEEGVNHLTHIANPLEFKKAMLNQKETKEHPPAPVASPAAVPPPPPPPPPPPTAGGDITRAIEELDALRKRGLLTDDEFNAKKRELLSRL